MRNAPTDLPRAPRTASPPADPALVAEPSPPSPQDVPACTALDIIESPAYKSKWKAAFGGPVAAAAQREDSPGGGILASVDLEPEPQLAPSDPTILDEPPQTLEFPPPPKTKTFNAEALQKYRLTRAAYEQNTALGLLLAELRGDDKREPKCYASQRGSEMQLHVQDLDAALTQLQALDGAVDWQFWAVGRSMQERQRARRIALTPTAAALQRIEVGSKDDGSDIASNGFSMPTAVEPETAVTRLAQRVAEGQSLEQPDTFKTNPTYKVTKDIEEIYRRWDQQVSPEEMPIYEGLVRALVEAEVRTEREFQQVVNQLRKRLHMTPKKSKLLHVYNVLVAEGSIKQSEPLRLCMIKKSSKSSSGVLVITVLTSPYPSYTDPATGDKVTQRFSCQWNCYYCPDEPDQPRSYLHDEPSVLRANQNEFDPVLQFTDRAATLAINGHPVDKIELLVLGGTWASYPIAYQEEFCRDLFYAANTFYQRKKRERQSLLQEQQLNESATCKIIGLTLETRPDCITVDEVRRFRKYGCTRVQLGIQHTNGKILKKINRGCTTADAVRAIRLLKDACYKIDIHLMPNLPGATPQIDKEMFEDVLNNPDLQVDQWKIYPCETVPWTVIKKWYETGKYKPYDEGALFEMLIEIKARMHPWIRLNRVIRDIPSQYILGGLNVPNMRQDLLSEMGKRGLRCRCIRCREVGEDKHNAVARAELVERQYHSSGAVEYFLSFETKDRAETICGFLRLRLPLQQPLMAEYQNDEHHEPCQLEIQSAFPELTGCALIRELHVYGVIQAVGRRSASTVAPTIAGDGSGVDEIQADCVEAIKLDSGTTGNSEARTKSQHGGFGRKLMQRAEDLALEAGFSQIAVISGVGVRHYYRRLGYNLVGEGQFLIKGLKSPHCPTVVGGAVTVDSYTAKHHQEKDIQEQEQTQPAPPRQDKEIKRATEHEETVRVKQFEVRVEEQRKEADARRKAAEQTDCTCDERRPLSEEGPEDEVEVAADRCLSPAEDLYHRQSSTLRNGRGKRGFGAGRARTAKDPTVRDGKDEVDSVGWSRRVRQLIIDESSSEASNSDTDTADSDDDDDDTDDDDDNESWVWQMWSGAVGVAALGLFVALKNFAPLPTSILVTVG